jgi:hypothetical protein
MLNTNFFYCYAECRYADCLYGDCRYAECLAAPQMVGYNPNKTPAYYRTTTKYPRVSRVYL